MVDCPAGYLFPEIGCVAKLLTKASVADLHGIQYRESK
jgi:hypothetical protein